MWTPDPSVLIGPHEYSDSISGAVPDDGGAALPKSEARFLTPNNTFVTVQVGNPAALRCQVERVASSETVSGLNLRLRFFKMVFFFVRD